MKKIDLLLVAFSLVVWTGCASAPKSSPVSWEDSISEVWEGVGHQFGTGKGSTWSIKIGSDGARYYVAYPSLGCDGSLVLKKETTREKVFLEHIQHGLANCITSGTVKLTQIEENLIQYDWYQLSGLHGATGTLMRTRTAYKTNEEKIYPPLVSTEKLQLEAKRQKQAEEKSIKTAGTGFSFGSSGYILTNYHVVKGSKHIKVKYLNGDVFETKIIIKDEPNDIAFLKPERSPKLLGANIALGDSSAMRIGDKVFTIGFPMSNILGQQPRYSEGVINSLAGVGDNPKAFQISIPIQSGNSGGPLFNQKGEVVGIVSSSLDSANTFQIFGNAPQNVNFSIKSNFVKNLLPMIPDALVSPTDIVVVPRGSDSLSGFIDRVQNNIVLIEAEY